MTLAVPMRRNSLIMQNMLSGAHVLVVNSA